MSGVRTRGHAAALGAAIALMRGRTPHAVLLVGPAGVGKTTLALDIAAGLLCVAPDLAARPCGTCRACRLVASGGHADLHRLAPEGPGRQVVIGGTGSKTRGIRDLVADLALMPVEGGARVAIIESAQRMNEDAQAALLKTLEEPPAGVTLILCADAEEPLLPTIRSRCARLRLGPVGARAMEEILAGHGVADVALAARLARIAGGRPGLALAWAGDPAALRLRDELSRVLLDLTAARPAERLAAIRSAVAQASILADLVDRPAAASVVAPGPVRTGAGTRGRAATAATAGASTPGAAATVADADREPPDGSPPTDTDPDAEAEVATSTRIPAAERRRAAEAVIAVWTDVARDVLLSRHGQTASMRDPRLLDDVAAVVTRLDEAATRAFLDRLGRAAVLLAGNVAPELILDDLALAWPQRAGTAA